MDSENIQRSMARKISCSAKTDGSSWNPDVSRRDVLYPVFDRLNIDRPTRSAGFHRFRHSAASIINAVTGNMKLAQKQLVHATLDMTANVYTHTDAETEREGADACRTGNL